jgi:hypothetical protein
MTATTDHYLGIDVDKQEAQVAVLDDEGEVTEKGRVANADLDELAQKYAGSNAALEVGSNHCLSIERLLTPCLQSRQGSEAFWSRSFFGSDAVDGDVQVKKVQHALCYRSMVEISRCLSISINSIFSNLSNKRRSVGA